MIGLLADARLWLALMWACEAAVELALLPARRLLWSFDWTLLHAERRDIYGYDEWLRATPGIRAAARLLPVEACCAGVALHCLSAPPQAEGWRLITLLPAVFAAACLFMSPEHARECSMYGLLDSFARRYAYSCLPVLTQRLVALAVTLAMAPHH